MTPLRSQTDNEEFARRGDELYDREVEPTLGRDHVGKFVVIDIDTGDFEVGSDEVEVSDRLLERRPNAQVWLRRVGLRYARRFGSRFRTAA